MSDIQHLLKLSTRLLENQALNNYFVGNRPMHPIIFLFNDILTKEDYDDLYSKLERIWPQSVRMIPFVKYSLTGKEEPVYSLYPEENQVSLNDIRTAVDKERCEAQLFENMQKINIVCVTDTTGLFSVEEFQKIYEFGLSFKDTLIDDCNITMVTLLNDTTAHRKTANEIRGFLSVRTDYTYQILAANRTRAQTLCEMNDLNKVVGCVSVLLNSKDYYTDQNSNYIVQYLLKESPNKTIAYQLLQTILDEAKQECNLQSSFDVRKWTNFCGFENRRSSFCEETVSKIDIDFSISDLSHIPLNENAFLHDFSITENLPFNKISPFIYRDAFEYFVESYIGTYLKDHIDFSSCFGEFEKKLLCSASVSDFCSLTDEQIDRILAELDAGTCNENDNVISYVKQTLVKRVRVQKIYEGYKNILMRLRNNAVAVKEMLFGFSREFMTYNPVLNSEFGDYYAKICSRTLHQSDSKRCINELILNSTDRASFTEKMYNTFLYVVEHNAEEFRIPFIEAWEKRLNTRGEEIYREISEEINANAEQQLYLYGNYPINTVNKYFFLRTTSDSGTGNTKLYEYLKRAFADVGSIKYYDTRYDGALEVISLIKCNGQNLTI